MLPDPLPYLKTLHQKYGNVFYAYFALNRKSVLLLGPEAAEQALISQADLFSNEWGYLDLSPLLGKRGLLFQDGSAHKVLRRSINPAFKPDNLRQHASIVATEVDGQLAKWMSSSSTIATDIRLMTLRIASQTIVGASVGAEADTINRSFLDMVGAIMSLLPKLPGTPKWKGHRARTQIDQFFRSRIVQRRKRPGSDVFFQLCMEGLELSDDEIVDNMVGVLFAAYETTSSTISMMLHALASHPVWQDKLRRELSVLRNAEVDVLDAMQNCVQSIQNPIYSIRKGSRQHD